MSWKRHCAIVTNSSEYATGTKVLVNMVKMKLAAFKGELVASLVA